MTVIEVLDAVEDPRAYNVRHNLTDILFVALVATLCGAASCTEMAIFAETRRPILLDTCAALRLANDERLEARAEAALADAAETEGLVVSPITAWEVGLLVARGRIALSRPPHVWFEEMIESGLQLAPMPPKRWRPAPPRSRDG